MINQEKVVKEFEGLSAAELVDSPISALQGVSEEDAQKLEQFFGIKTIRDMANNEFYQKALAIKRMVEGDAE